MSEKGKYASATANRRFVWSRIVWPLILELGDVSFTLKQFQRKRDVVCGNSIPIMIPSRGLASLIQRGVIFKEGGTYSIHFRLIPYMRLGAECDYATAMQEVRFK